MNELPSVALTKRFLGLCQDYGNAGAAGLPATDDWTEWDADQMRAAVNYLERKRGVR